MNNMEDTVRTLNMNLVRIRSRNERKCGKGHMRKHNGQRLPRINEIVQFLH